MTNPIHFVLFQNMKVVLSLMVTVSYMMGVVVCQPKSFIKEKAGMHFFAESQSDGGM